MTKDTPRNRRAETNEPPIGNHPYPYCPLSSTSSLPLSISLHIFSYVIQTYQDIARLRLVSKDVNQNLIPTLLRNRNSLISTTVNTSSIGKDTINFIQDLCNIEEGTKVGETLRINSDNQDFFFQGLQIESMLIVDFYYDEEEVDEVEARSNLRNKTSEDDSSLESYILCTQLHECDSLCEFTKLKENAIDNGLFVPILRPKKKQRKNDTDEGLDEEDDSDYEGFVIAILTFTPHGRDIGKDGTVIDNLVLHGKSGDIEILPRRCDIGCTFRGYVKDGKVQVPMFLSMDEDLYQNEIESVDLLPVREVLNRHQYKMNVTEGISIVDGAVPRNLHDKLMKEIDNLARTEEVDYHPNSNNIVRDLVHPSLFPYIKGVSVLNKPNHNSQLGNLGGEQSKDYWGRKYETSLKYQWLPTYFDIAMDGSCTICDYINNLVPAENYTELYSSLEKLFAHALPQLESVYSYGCAIHPRLRYSDADHEELDMRGEPLPLDEKYISLKGRQLQVVTKIVDYELGPGETYEGVWHVEGMSHEEIVATAIYFIHRDDDITGGNILFKRTYLHDEAECIFTNVPQCRAEKVDEVIQDGFIPLGQVETLSNRLLVFPNSHIHKVQKMENTCNNSCKSTDEAENVGGEKIMAMKYKEERQKRRIIVFFLINPEKRIVSTREVDAQQVVAGGSVSREKAFEHRLEMMKERKYTKQDWNVRKIELCEH